VHTGDTVTFDPLAILSIRYIEMGDAAYPTDRTRPVSDRPASSCTPRILCSRMDETSVGEALASAA
jgi:hypothetical protein